MTAWDSNYGIVPHPNAGKDPKSMSNRALRQKHETMKRFSRALHLHARDDLLPSDARETIQQAADGLRRAQEVIETEYRNRIRRNA